MLLPIFARALRLAAIAISLIAVAWFVSFAVDQSSSASYHQQAEVNAAATPGTTTAPTPPSNKESGLHETVDKAFSTFSSPFAGVTGSSSAWLNHIVEALLVLAVYGFGLGFVARLLRMVA